MATRRGYGIKKRLTDMGLHRGAQHAFRPVPRPLEPNIVLTDERLRVPRNVFWVGAAAMYAVGGLIPLAGALLAAMVPTADVPAELISPVVLTTAVAALAFACFWLYMGSRNTPAMPWMDFIIGSGTLLIAVIALSAENYAPDILCYFLLPAVSAAFFLPFRQAKWHLLAIATVELYIAFTSTEVAYGKLISLTMLFFTLIAAAMLMVARKRIQDGIVHNVSLAGRDPLTGVANLRKFNERLQSEIDRAERGGESLTLLMIDLDDFKRVNDEYSYTLGDAVLVASARAMSRVVRANELLARRGGDEFAVIAAGAHAGDAEALGERIGQAVRRERLKLCPDVTPDASVGIAEWRIGETADDLVRRADSALHVSKIIAHTDEPFTET